MNNKTIACLERQIIDCKKRLKELALDIEVDEEKSKEYNKIIVQKAILVDKYKKLCFRPSLAERARELARKIIGNTIGYKEEDIRICDYFEV